MHLTPCSFYVYENFCESASSEWEILDKEKYVYFLITYFSIDIIINQMI